MNKIAGKWAYHDSNRNVAPNDLQFIPIGTQCVFSNDGYMFFLLENSEIMKLNYDYSDSNNSLKLVFSNGTISNYIVNYYHADDGDYMRITDAYGRWDAYKKLSNP